MKARTTSYQPLGFREAKRRALFVLESHGDIQHEVREAITEKNLLATGDINVAEVASLIRSCSGIQYRSMPHDRDQATEVHLFLPGRGMHRRSSWYIKLYFRQGITFISVHR